jgi:hypothetical protein
MEEFLFELGKVLLKTELSKRESSQLLRQMGGHEKETVLLQKIGKYWNQQKRLDRPDGLVVVTTHRLVFLTKMETLTTTTDFLSFPFDTIEALEQTRVWLTVPAIRFHVLGKPYMFTFFANAGEVMQAIQRARTQST